MSPYFVRHWQSLFNNDFGKCADAFAEAEIQHPHENCHQCNKADNSKGISDKFFFAGPAELFGFSKNFFEISSDAGEKSADFFEKARLLSPVCFTSFFIAFSLFLIWIPCGEYAYGRNGNTF